MTTEKGKQNSAHAGSGFTLIELMVVIAVISLVAMLVLPRLPATDSAKLASSARSLATAIRYLGERSITAKTHYRLHFNLSEGTIEITRKGATGEELPPEDAFLGRRFLADGVVVADVELSRLGKVATGEVAVDFGSGGLEEFLTVHLQGAGGTYFTVAAYPQNGKVKLHEGYRDNTP